VTINAQSQLNEAPMEEPLLMASLGKISALTVQAKGPKPMEKKKM